MIQVKGIVNMKFWVYFPINVFAKKKRTNVSSNCSPFIMNSTVQENRFPCCWRRGRGSAGPDVGPDTSD